MKNKNRLLLLLLSITITALYGQNGKNIYYSGDGERYNIGFTNGYYENDYFTVFGYFYGDSLHHNAYQGPIFTRIDTNGVMLQKITIVDSTKTYLVDENIVNIAPTQDKKGYIGLLNDGQEHVSYLDNMGNFLNHNENIKASTTVYEPFWKVVKMGKGHLIIGQKFNTMYQGNQINLFDIDSVGQIIWHKEWGSKSEIKLIQSVYSISDTSIMIGYLIYGGGPTTSRSALLEVTASGIITKRYESPLKEQGALAIARDSKGNWIYTSGYWLAKKSGLITKLSPTFEEIWKKKYGKYDQEKTRFNDVQVLPNDDIIVLGNKGLYSDTTMPYLKGWLMRVSSEGDSLWQRSVFPTYTDQDIRTCYLSASHLLPSGNIVAIGGGEPHWADSKFRGWFIKFDVDGCILVNDCPTTVATREVEMNKNRWQVFPNPSANNIAIRSEMECDQIKISSLDGNYQTRLPYNDTLNIGFLCNGVYVLHFIYNGKVVGYQKLVKIE